MHVKFGISLALALGALAAVRPAAATEDMSKLYPDQYLFRGQRITSANCRYFAQMQTDGNFVTYFVGANGVLSSLWASESHWNGYGRPYFAVQQSDGNFVVYNASMSTWRFAMGTNYHSTADILFGHYGSGVFIQGDGNFVQRGYDGSLLWHSGNSGVTASVPCWFPPSKTQVLYNTDLPGENLPGSPFNLTWFPQCGDACAQNSACKAWSFTGNGLCWLKSSKPAASPLSGVTSGFIVK